MSELKSKKIIVVLEQAHLEVVKTPRGNNILNPDMHLSMIKNMKLDPSHVRPDILYQCLRVLQDSPLNRSGHLKVLIRTKQNKLIKVAKQLKVPNSFEKFCKLFTQLLYKLRVNALSNKNKGGKRLLKLVKNNLAETLPAGIKTIGFTHKATNVVDVKNIVPHDGRVVVVIGTMAHGSVTDSCADILTEEVSISSYPLSGALACGLLCDGAAEVWNIENQYLD